MPASRRQLRQRPRRSQRRDRLGAAGLPGHDPQGLKREPVAESGASYTAYAANPGDPRWQRFYAAEVQYAVNHGYGGVFMDDFNLFGIAVTGTPIDPNTGQAMTLANWQKDLDEFQQRRARFLLYK